MKDINEVMDDIGMGSFQYIQLLFLGGIIISDGAEILVSSSILSALAKRWGLSHMVKGSMMSIIFVGVAIGGVIGGQLADIYGRRKTVLASYAGIVVFGALTAAANGPASMISLRFWFGLSFGMGIAPGVALQVETAPSNWRGHVVNIGTIWFTIGEIYTASLLLIFMPNLTGELDPSKESWRYVTLLTTVPGLLLMPFAVLLLQESAHFLIVQGRHEEAMAAVRYIANMNRKTEVIRYLEDEGSVDISISLHSERSSLVEGEVTAAALPRPSSSSARVFLVSQVESNEMRELQMSFSDRFWTIWNQEFRTIVIGGCYLCFLSNFLFYGLTYELPQIFQKLHNEISPAFEVLVVSICDLPGVVLAFLLLYVNVIGHRDSLVLLAVCSSVLQLALISIDHVKHDMWFWVGLPSAYLSKYTASAFFTITYIYLGEVFPSNCRCTALSCCIATGRLGSILAPILFEAFAQVADRRGRHAPFLIVNSALCVIAVVVIRTMLPFELKNAPLEAKSKARRPSSEMSHLEHGLDAAGPSEPPRAG